MSETNTPPMNKKGPVVIGLITAVAVFVVMSLLMNIVDRKQEAGSPYFRVAEINDEIDDPAVWGKIFLCNTTAT